MKPSRKSKQNVFLNIQKPNSKTSNIKNHNISTSSEHKKLLQYRDYLLSLRKMDLGSLINKNRNKQEQLTTQKPKQYPYSFSQVKQKIQKKQNEQPINPQIKSQQRTRKNWLIQKSFKQFDVQRNNNINPFEQKLKKSNFKLNIPTNINEDELYCDQEIQDFFNVRKHNTPRIMHISNFSNNYERDLSTNRSSRCRDFSMPSIQQRNLSQQNQEIVQEKQKVGLRSISGELTQRKYNSCSHNYSVQQQKQQKIRKNLVMSPICLTSRNKKQNKMDRTFDKQNLISTEDVNTNSGNKSARLNIKNFKNIEVNPFHLRSDFNSQKQNKKLSLNVSQIVKRINSRQSKSSMSDKSYKKKNQNKKEGDNKINVKNMVNVQKQIEFKQFNQNQFNFDNSSLLLGNFKLSGTQQVIKKKSFKTQVREFREKNYLMMKLVNE